MKKKVVKLLSQSFLPIQGRYPRIYSEAVTLRDIGYDVLVVGWDRTGRCDKKESYDGITVERIKVKSSEMRGPVQIFFLLSFWIKVFIRLLFEKIDAIHCHNLDILPLGYVLSKVKRCPVFYDAHEPNYYALWPGKWQKFLGIINAIESFLSKRVDCVIVTNNYQLTKFKKIGVKNTVLVGNYPVPSFIIEKVPQEKFQKSEIIFGRIGTIYQNVGIEETAEAFKYIVNKHNRAKMLLAGRIVETYRPDLMRSIGGLEDRIELLGPYHAEEIPNLYRRIDVSLMIYRKNNWFRQITPTKFYDSLANGVPVIMTDIGGLGEIIETYNCGIVVDENDIPGICRAMEQLIDDRELRRKMSENGLNLIKQEFNWKKMEAKLQHIYETI